MGTRPSSNQKPGPGHRAWGIEEGLQVFEKCDSIKMLRPPAFLSPWASNQAAVESGASAGFSLLWRILLFDPISPEGRRPQSALRMWASPPQQGFTSAFSRPKINRP